MGKKKIKIEKGNTKILIIIGVIVLVGIIGYVFLQNKSNQYKPGTTLESKVLVNEVGDNKLQYDNPTYRIRLVYPKDWQRQDTSLPAYQSAYGAYITAVVLRPPVVQSVDQGSGTINVVIGDEKEGTTLEALTSVNVSQISSAFQNYQAISSSSTTLAGLPAYEVIYTGQSQGINMKLRQVWTIKDNKSYAVTYRISPDSYDTYESVSFEVIRSLENY